MNLHLDNDSLYLKPTDSFGFHEQQVQYIVTSTAAGWESASMLKANRQLIWFIYMYMDTHTSYACQNRGKREIFWEWKNSKLLYKFIVNYDTGSTVMPTSASLPSDGENMVLMLDLKPLG